MQGKTTQCTAYISNYKRIILSQTYCIGNAFQQALPVAMRSKAWVSRRSLAGIAGSNPAGGMDLCLLWILCVVRYRYLRRADHSSRGVLPSVVCLSVIAKPCEERSWTAFGSNRHRKKKVSVLYCKILLSGFLVQNSCLSSVVQTPESVYIQKNLVPRNQ